LEEIVKYASSPKDRSFWWEVIKKFVPERLILKERHMDKLADSES
jgi:hypothetical protein